jgi:hypothetical protein
MVVLYFLAIPESGSNAIAQDQDEGILCVSPVAPEQPALRDRWPPPWRAKHEHIRPASEPPHGTPQNHTACLSAHLQKTVYLQRKSDATVGKLKYRFARLLRARPHTEFSYRPASTIGSESIARANRGAEVTTSPAPWRPLSAAAICADTRSAAATSAASGRRM